MITADFINSMFEIGGGFFVLNHCRVAYLHKEVKGVSMLSNGFFLSFGLWNLYYYPSLGQWMSYGGAIFLVLANLLYLSMHTYYTFKPSVGVIKNKEGLPIL